MKILQKWNWSWSITILSAKKSTSRIQLLEIYFILKIKTKWIKIFYLSSLWQDFNYSRPNPYYWKTHTDMELSPWVFHLSAWLHFKEWLRHDEECYPARILSREETAESLDHVLLKNFEKPNGNFAPSWSRKAFAVMYWVVLLWKFQLTPSASTNWLINQEDAIDMEINFFWSNPYILWHKKLI